MQRVRRIFKRLATRIPVKVRLRVGQPAEFPAVRNFAYCTAPGGRPIVTVAPKMAFQPRHRIEALLRHELAHAVLMSRGVEHSERETDALAEVLFGHRISYDHEDVQTLRPGTRPRPRRLG